MDLFEPVPGASVALVRHPGERRGAPLVLACGGCCCCCCCCLHTIGSLIVTAGVSARVSRAAKVALVATPLAAPGLERAPTRTFLRCRKCGEVGQFEWAGPAGEPPRLTCRVCGSSGSVLTRAALTPSLAAADAGSRAGESASRLYGKRVYWITLLVLSALPFLAGQNEEGVALGVGFFLPLIQILASVVALVVIAASPGSAVPQKRAAVGVIGRLTVACLIGTAVGVGIMVLAFVAIGMR